MAIFRPEGAAYVEAPTSDVLPPLTAEALSHFIEESWAQRRTVWMRNVREWVRRHSRGGADDPTA